MKDTDNDPAGSEKKWNKDSSIINNFPKGSRHVARLMANIPTYMIFDDHDVTDDWNLTKENFEHFTSESIIAKNVLVNALSAYTIFQHWGNRPSPDIESMMLGVQRVYGELGFDQWRQLEPFFTEQERHYFGYAIETEPPMVVLDTRTHRSFNGGLALMDTVAFMKLKHQLTAISDGYGPLLLVSPTPVFGFNSIEALQIFVGPLFPEGIDMEPWIANPEALLQLRNILASSDFKDIYTLSGDVHYSFVRLESQVEVGNKKQNWWQLTTSPSCNVPFGEKRFYRFSDTLGHFNCWRRTKTHYLRPTENDEQDVVIQGYCNYGLLTLDATNSTFTVCRAIGDAQKSLTYKLSAQAKIFFAPDEVAEPA